MSTKPEPPHPDLPDPQPRGRRLQRFRDDAEEEPPAPPPTSTLDPERDLPGAIYMVPNEQWEIDSDSSEDHPGACAIYQERTHSAILIKGTDADNLRDLRGYYVVSPTPENGLYKRTAFELVPRYFRLHKVRVFYPERYLGQLDETTLFALCHEMARVCGEE
jgi:hypothetical protein